MRFMDGSQRMLALGLAVGLCAFWLAAPPTTNANGGILGGWVAAEYFGPYIASETAIGGMPDFYQIGLQSCAWYWRGSTYCYGGNILVGVPSWTGRKITYSNSTPCQGYCNEELHVQDAATE